MMLPLQRRINEISLMSAASYSTVIPHRCQLRALALEQASQCLQPPRQKYFETRDLLQIRTKKGMTQRGFLKPDTVGY